MNACNASFIVNDMCHLDNVAVNGEHKGRTTHRATLDDDIPEEGSIEVHFNSGAGVLYLSFFELRVRPC